MKILVDADACPKPIKEILFRAANRLKISTLLLANQPLRVPMSPFIKFLQVSSGLDVADNMILNLLEKGDLVITADIPLAAAVVAKAGYALNPRGEFYSTENVQQKLTMRNFMETLRETGQALGGPSSLTARDHQAFGNALDKFLAKITKKK